MTATTWQRRALFKNAQWADLFLETLHSYRGRGYLLHEYVLMPDHFHVLVTPVVTLERAVQFIKGGFSFRVKKELQSGMEVWQRGFSDHRIRDWQDFETHVGYIYRNPVGRKLVESAVEYPYCSAFPGSTKDEVPQWLKPTDIGPCGGTAEAVPFQSAQAGTSLKGIFLIFSVVKPSFASNTTGGHAGRPSEVTAMFLGWADYATAACACLHSAANPAASLTARSARILRSSSMPAFFRPLMNWL